MGAMAGLDPQMLMLALKALQPTATMPTNPMPQTALSPQSPQSAPLDAMSRAIQSLRRGQLESTPGATPTPTSYSTTPDPNVMGGAGRNQYYQAQSDRQREEWNVPPSGQAEAPVPQLDEDVTRQAVIDTKRKYPRFAQFPIALSTGKGPGWSETYEPTDSENPHPGHWTVQLRSPQALSGKYDSTVGFEMIHALQQEDPEYQKLTDEFIKTMTPAQIADSKRAYEDEKKDWPNPPPFKKWLPHVQAQEYIRGGVFTDVIPNWVGPKGKGKYTPEQIKLLAKIKGYLQTPAAKSGGGN